MTSRYESVNPVRCLIRIGSHFPKFDLGIIGRDDVKPFCMQSERFLAIFNGKFQVE